MKKELEILRAAIVKVTHMLTGQGLKVTQRGMDAYVRADHNGKPILVNIPYLPDNADESLILAIAGFLDHEIAHIFFSDFKASKKFGQEVGEAAHSLFNIVEDSYIERAMAKKLPGTAFNLDLLHEFFLAKLTKPALEKVAGKLADEIAVLMPVFVRSWAGQKAFQRYLEETKIAERPDIAMFLKRVPPALITRFPRINSTAESIEVTRQLMDALIKEPPPPSSKPSKEKDKSGKGSPENGGSSGETEEPTKSDPSEDSGPEEGAGEKPEKNEKPEKKEKGGEDKKPKKEEEKPESDDEEDDADAESEGDEPEDEEDDSKEDDTDDKGEEPKEDGDEGEEAEGDDSEEDGDGGSDQDDTEDGEDADEGDDADDETDGDEDGEGAGDGSSDEDGDEEGGSSGKGSGEGDEEGDGAGLPDEMESDDEEGGAHAPPTETGRSVMSSIKEIKETDFEKAISDTLSKSAAVAAMSSDYVIYTNEFDVIEEGRISYSLDDSAIAKIDDQTSHMIGKMQKDIERMMAAQSQVVKVPGYRSGRLHTAGLHRLMAGDDRVFRRKFENASKDTAVGLLIDNSGSMGGGYSRGSDSKFAVAMKAGYALAQTLDRVGITSECMGFTTTYLRTSIPSTPGVSYARIEPLYMPIFKKFSERFTPTVRKRFASAIFANTVDLRNNVDGECVAIAARRLLTRKEKRKVLLVLSDGQPSCSSYNPFGLREHLRRTVEDVTKMGVETIGIGIMDDSVKHYYPRHLVLHRVEDLPACVMGELRRILIA